MVVADVKVGTSIVHVIDSVRGGRPPAAWAGWPSPAAAGRPLQSPRARPTAQVLVAKSLVGDIADLAKKYKHSG